MPLNQSFQLSHKIVSEKSELKNSIIFKTCGTDIGLYTKKRKKGKASKEKTARKRRKGQQGKDVGKRLLGKDSEEQTARKGPS